MERRALIITMILLLGTGLLCCDSKPRFPILDGGIGTGSDGDSDGDADGDGDGDGDTDSDADSDSDTDLPIDGGIDAGTDGLDGGLDAGTDGGIDAGESDTDTEIHGLCTDISPLFEDVPLTGTTEKSDNNLSHYSCTELWENGPDNAYSFINLQPTAVKIQVTLTQNPTDLDLFILKDHCSQDACVAASTQFGDTEQVSWVVAPMETVYIIVDGYNGVVGQYLLSLSTHPAESSCTNNIDDDGDTLIDCDDADCHSSPACVLDCFEQATLACNETIGGTTIGQNNDLQLYRPLPQLYDGNDSVFAFFPTGEGFTATADFSSQYPNMALIALEETCRTNSVLQLTTSGNTATLSTQQPTFLVVDATWETAGQFQITTHCTETNCQDTIDNDADGQTDCADADCQYGPDCTTSCHLLKIESGCPTPEDGDPPIGCYLNPDTAQVDSPTGFCHTAGDAGVGDTCDEPFDCIPGAICTAPQICMNSCDLEDNEPGCDNPLDCRSIGMDPLGVCWSF